jgi:hypothetical protein
MGVSAYNGTRISGATTVVHTGQGWLLAVLISHNQAAVQTATVYDNTAATGTVALQVSLPAGASPFYCEFLHPIEVSQGITVVAPANVDVHLWAKGR